MAPKRKRAAETPAQGSTRVTRASSSRTKSPAAASEDILNPRAAASTKGTADGADDGDSPLPAKKAKKTPAKSASSKGNARKKAPGSMNEVRAEGSAQDNTVSSSVDAPKKSSEPYALSRAQSLFGAYADEDDPSVIGPEGFERLCSDMQVSLEGALPLLLAWQLNASEMAKITKAEWEKGLDELEISSLERLALALRELEDLVLLDKPPVKTAAPPAQAKRKVAAFSQPYNRTRYRKYSENVQKAFSELYSYCFVLAKPPQARNIDIETATAFWAVLVVPRHSIMSDVLEFINEKGTYKGVTKDLWSMMLEFCRSVKLDLSDYEADGAWPTMLDDFVAWKNAQTTGVGAE